MKKIIFAFAIFGILTLTANAQLGIPSTNVKDTFKISNVYYNGTELHKTDWPDTIIMEDALKVYIAKYVYVKGKLIGSFLNVNEYNATCNGKQSKMEIKKYPGGREYNMDGYRIVSSPLDKITQKISDIDVQYIFKEPEISTKALFNKANKATDDQGYEGVDPNSNRYDGASDKGGAGFSLSGRSAKALPTPQVNQNKQGKVVVKIWVDRAGNVTNVSAPEKGSTLTDPGYANQAKAAARKAKFNAKEDAPETQTGTITYVFKTN